MNAESSCIEVGIERNLKKEKSGMILMIGLKSNIFNNSEDNGENSPCDDDNGIGGILEEEMRRAGSCVCV